MCQRKPRTCHSAVREGCRFLSATFLSLCLPLSFLALARFSIERYLLPFADDSTIRPPEFPLLTCRFLLMTLTLSILALLIAVAALMHCLTGSKAAFVINERCRLYAACLMLFWMQVCMVLGIQGSVDAEIKIHTVGRSFVPRRLAFALGLHETTVFWGAAVVKPVVDTAIFGFLREGCTWVEKAVLAVGFGNLWWRRLREEAEALAVLPRGLVKLRMDLGVADGVGWLLYYLTAGIGLVRTVKGLWWICRKAKNSNGGAVIPSSNSNSVLKRQPSIS